VARKWTREIHSVLVGKCKEKKRDQLVVLGVDGRIILKLIFNRQNERGGLAHDRNK
jgi:hypothetical protein